MYNNDEPTYKVLAICIYAIITMVFCNIYIIHLLSLVQQAYTEIIEKVDVQYTLYCLFRRPFCRFNSSFKTVFSDKVYIHIYLIYIYNLYKTTNIVYGP